MLLQPVSQAFAQEAPPAESGETAQPAGESVPAAESVEQTGPVSPGEEDVAEPQEGGEETKTEEPSEEPLEEELEEITIPEPPVGAAETLPPSTIKQKVPDADIVSGALVYQYPLISPAGRGGMQSGVNLSYNSQNTEEGSLVGHGWSLDLPSIERKNVNGLNKLYSSEDFSSSLDGDLKKTGSASGVANFAAKIDGGSFSKYAFSNDASGGTWTVKNKTGLTYTFGAAPEAKLSNPDDATKVFRWHLSKVEDVKGNFVTYGYTKIDDQVYPAAINYTGHGTDQGIYKVQFNLEDRFDKAMSAKYGFMVKTTKRVASVEVLVQNVVVGHYVLSYEQAVPNNRSLLNGVEFTGFDVAGQNGISDGGMGFSYESIGASNLMTKIKQNTGGETVVTYKSSAQYRDASGAGLNPNLPFAMQTVHKIQYDDRNGVVWANEFEYAGGWFYYNDPMDRRFVGFEKVVRTDSVGNTMASFYHQGNTTNTTYGELADDWAKAGKAYKTELRDSQGNLFSQNLNTWQFIRMPSVGDTDGRSFAKLAQTVARTFDGDQTHKDRASSYSYDSDTGNLVSATDWGEVTGADNGTFTDVGTDKIISSIDYAVSATNPELVGVGFKSVTTNQAGQKISESREYFDNLPLGQIGVGDVTKEESWISGSNYSTIIRTFNSFHLPQTETDPRGNTTTYAYDAFNLYPITVTNALSHTTNFEYDYRFGKAVKTIDANGLVSKVTLDGLGREVKQEYTVPRTRPDNSFFTKKTTSYELYQQNGEVKGWKTIEENWLDAPDAAQPRKNKVVTYTDGFDRPIQIRAQAESQFSVLDTAYNNIGQVDKTSLPYFSDGETRTAATTDAALFASLSYDPLYRVASTTDAVGTTSNVYDDWKVTTTDANGKIKSLHKDAFDRLVRVDENNNSETYVTEYEYNGRGDLVKITDALDNEREFSYDGLGRRLEAEDLHAPGDSTFGVWQYEYDDAGNLTSRTDANGQVVNYVYDALNRVVTETPVGVSGGVTYIYDGCRKGVGRLCNVNNGTVAQTNEYNVLGQVTQETKVIGGQTFVSEYVYDRQGNILILKNPDNSEVKYDYNIAGQLESVQSKESGAANFGNVVTNMDYAPTGAVTSTQYANGAITSNTYDAAQVYRFSQKTTTLPLPGGGTKTVQNLAYTYDPSGNITRIADTSELNTAKVVDYGYDDLHRLISAQTVPGPNDPQEPVGDGSESDNQTYSYDAIGNIISKSDVGTYTYGGSEGVSYANPHAVTLIESKKESRAYEYDQNGNVLEDGKNSYVWDYNNRIETISVASGTPINYGYDSSGMRASDGVITYPTKFFNTSGGLTGSGVQKHIFAGENLAATIKGTGTGAAMAVVHSDHLGSTVVTSDASANVSEIVDYWPFGGVRSDEVIGGGSAEQRKFTGHEYDVDTGLSYMEARYYDPSIGRFLSQDPVFWNTSMLPVQLADPQSWNSYSYARNNPIVLRDPDGQFWDTVVDLGFLAYDSVKFLVNSTKAIEAAVSEKVFTAVGMPNIAAQARADKQYYSGKIASTSANLGLSAVGTAIPFAPVAGIKAVQKVEKGIDIAASARQAGVAEVSPLLRSGDVYSQTAEHVLRDSPTRYPGMSADDIGNLARETQKTANTTGTIRGIDPRSGQLVNKDYYGSKSTGQMFIKTNLGPPTMFPKRNINSYIESHMSKDLGKFGRR